MILVGVLCDCITELVALSHISISETHYLKPITIFSFAFTCRCASYICLRSNLWGSICRVFFFLNGCCNILGLLLRNSIAKSLKIGKKKNKQLFCLTFLGVDRYILTERSFSSSVRRADPGNDPSIVMKTLKIVPAGSPH